MTPAAASSGWAAPAPAAPPRQRLPVQLDIQVDVAQPVVAVDLRRPAGCISVDHLPSITGTARAGTAAVSSRAGRCLGLQRPWGTWRWLRLAALGSAGRSRRRWRCAASAMAAAGHAQVGGRAGRASMISSGPLPRLAPTEVTLPMPGWCSTLRRPAAHARRHRPSTRRQHQDGYFSPSRRARPLKRAPAGRSARASRARCPCAMPGRSFAVSVGPAWPCAPRAPGGKRVGAASRRPVAV